MNIERLQQRITILKQRPAANHALLDRLQAWLIQSSLADRYRINIVRLATELGYPLPTVLGECLYAVPVGLFDLYWDLHCPMCNTIAAELQSLNEAPSLTHCSVCVMDFTADFAERVEVTFSLNTEIENEPAPTDFFKPLAAFHPQYGLDAWYEQSVAGEADMAEGTYHFFSPITGSYGDFTVAGAPTPEVQEFSITETETGMTPAAITAQPGRVRLHYTNLAAPRSLLWVVSAADADTVLDHPPPILTGLQVSHHPVFRELFSDQVLSDRERLLISSVTTLFTDITGSTRMYETLGDAIAYNIVRDHFDILFRAIEDCGGRVLKTIGDAVMASFLNNEQAIRAIADFLTQIEAYNAQRNIPEQVWLKLGVHRGPAILVTLNDRLDYFGSSVNKAARIQGLARSGELACSAEVYADPAFRQVLDTVRIGDTLRQEVNLKGLEGNHTIYRTRLLSPPDEIAPSTGTSPMQRFLASLGLGAR